jgi:hypothetical protein
MIHPFSCSAKTGCLRSYSQLSALASSGSALRPVHAQSIELEMTLRDHDGLPRPDGQLSDSPARLLEPNNSRMITCKTNEKGTADEQGH